MRIREIDRCYSRWFSNQPYSKMTTTSDEQGAAADYVTLGPTGEDEFVDDDGNAASPDMAIPRSSEASPQPTPRRPATTLSAQGNFLLASTLFSVNHGCVTACLNLATARLGDVGAKQSSVLYLSYSASALLGSTWIIKKVRPVNGLILGMGLYSVYVGCFILAVLQMDHPVIAEVTALLGAAVGGLAGAILWTAQGSFFARSAEVHSQGSEITTLPDATSDLSAYFAAIYLFGEVALNLLSSVLVEAFGLAWLTVFTVYFVIAVVSVLGMLLVYEHPPADSDVASFSNTYSPNKATAAWRVLTKDPKMICMVPFNLVFGLAASFRASFVSSEVVRIALDDNKSMYVGELSAVTAVVAAVMSLIFGRISHVIGKGTILVIGSASFFLVAFPFVLFPDLTRWGWASVLCVYTLQGIGRSTFEGTLKAEFADFFSYEKEGAFANIVLQSGLSNALGFFLSINLPCSSPGTYCIEYADGTLHNVLSYELLIMVSAVLAALGYWRAAVLYRRENRQAVTGTSEEAVAFVAEADAPDLT